MTQDSVSEFVLDYVPSKVSTDADSAASIICELSMFWKHLDRVYKLPGAKEIVEWLETDGRVAQLEAELSDSSNFGMAKSLFMLGKNAGYDMTSQAGTAEFIAAYNRGFDLVVNKRRHTASRRFHSHAPVAPFARDQRVGRNEPCRCGSGKKFKKCCGRSSQQGSTS